MSFKLNLYIYIVVRHHKFSHPCHSLFWCVFKFGFSVIYCCCCNYYFKQFAIKIKTQLAKTHSNINVNYIPFRVRMIAKLSERERERDRMRIWCKICTSSTIYGWPEITSIPSSCYKDTVFHSHKRFYYYVVCVLNSRRLFFYSLSHTLASCITLSWPCQIAAQAELLDGDQFPPNFRLHLKLY